MAHEDGHFKEIECIGDYAHKPEILKDTNVSATFNMGDLAPCVENVTP